MVFYKEKAVLVSIMIVSSMCFMISMGAKMPCDIDSKNNSCPFGYCCVRNQSSFTDTYCQKLVGEGGTCATYASKFICPCGDKFFCEKSNDGDSFGRCKSKVVDIPCDLRSRNSSCPKGMCCVRDEFLFSYTYCKAYGVEGSNCVTHASFYECPCKTGYVCASNVQGGHVSSVFGSCISTATSQATTSSTGTPTTTANMKSTSVAGAAATSPASTAPRNTTGAPDGITTALEGTTRAEPNGNKTSKANPAIVG